MTIQTYLSNKGYAILKSSISDIELKIIKGDLTMSPNINNSFVNTEPPVFYLYRENNKKIYVPKSYGLKKYGKPLYNTIDEGENINLEFKGKLRENQIDCVKKTLNACNDENIQGGLINCQCAFGKTVVSIHILAQLKKKTLIIAHKNFLIEQWLERIRQYLPEARIGLIKAQTIDVENKDIILASLQSLAMKEYDPSIFKGIGTIIVDEIHRTGSEIFSRAYFQYTPRYSIGLSATPRRVDGLTKVFKYFIGDICFKNIKRTDTVDIICKTYKSNDPKYCEEKLLYNGKPIIASSITNISNFEERNNWIVDIIKDILEKESERNILLLSDRILQLEILKRKLIEKNIGKPGLYIGKMKQVLLDHTAENCNIILASFSLVSEGFDVHKLDTLILASSKVRVEQIVGRILRKKPEDREYNPLIIDIKDSFSIFPNQFKKRLTYYKKNKFNIIYDNSNTDNIIDNMDNTIFKPTKFLIKNDEN